MVSRKPLSYKREPVKLGKRNVAYISLTYTSTYNKVINHCEFSVDVIVKFVITSEVMPLSTLQYNLKIKDRNSLIGIYQDVA